MPAKHSIPDGMEGAAPDAAGINRQQIRHSIQHLPRSFVRERKQ